MLTKLTDLSNFTETDLSNIPKPTDLGDFTDSSGWLGDPLSDSVAIEPANNKRS
jgi:hypothetical protein